MGIILASFQMLRIVLCSQVIENVGQNLHHTMTTAGVTYVHGEAHDDVGYHRHVMT